MFRYSSRAQVLIYAWVNDEHGLRTDGSKTDATVVFRSMLESAIRRMIGRRCWTRRGGGRKGGREEGERRFCGDRRR
ncbi:type II toxin-antitoxin system YhaV family toxin [Allorhizobium pseudoryzae]|uniref:type II toxin-antitoxin system YhaV family toxin n=1 Tax=Allorhizobium pseudoryzae TaxID=379684 RepID=UPI003CFC71EF